MSTLFISDLHLHEERPLVTEAFFSFLEMEARTARSLFILGDLFDAWIGDDDDHPLSHAVARALQKLSATTEIFFQHGNRDFLLGENYAGRCGMTLLPELFVLERESERWLLAHGDQFCTMDLAYQAFRTQVRHPAWQTELLSKPLAERRAIARQLREKSQEANSLKAEDIMDVTPAEIEKALQEHRCSKLIHGHTHRPARHTLLLEGKVPAERIVLGDWDNTFWFLRHDNNTLQLIQQGLA